MTIALGFCHPTGVMLCADTELTGGDDRKLHAGKVFHFDSAIGRFGFVFAGNFANAIGTLQKIRAAILRSRSSDPLRIVEDILDREYTRLVLVRPPEERQDLAFQFIIAFRPPKGNVQMYVTEGVQIWQDTHSVAIGIGGAFAMQLIESGRLGMGSRSELLALGAYVLGAVKKNITQCGGMSLFIDIGHNGAITELYGDRYLRAIEDFGGVFQMLAYGLFACLTDSARSEKDFVANLNGFAGKMLDQRDKWDESKAMHLQHSEAYQLIHRSRVKQAQKSPKRDRKGRQP